MCCGVLLWMDCACEWDLWSGVSFAGSRVAVETGLVAVRGVVFCEVCNRCTCG